MDNEKEFRKVHCLVLSFPMQSHINPILQFSKRLKYRGIDRITFVTTKFFLKSVKYFPADTFPVETISDGFDDGGAEKEKPQDYFNICRKAGSETLGQLIEKLRSSGSDVDCLIYDPFYQWALDVAKKYGLKAAMFFTQSNSVNNIYFHAYKGELKLPVSEAEIRIPGGLPPLEPADLPSFILEHGSDPVRSDMMIKQFRNVEMVDWIFVNTFYELEHEVRQPFV